MGFYHSIRFLGIIFLLGIINPLRVDAQFTYVVDQSIPVEVNGKVLRMPWAGGLNSAQINTMDLDGDGDRDLVVFDRSTNKVSTFLNQSSEYFYHPEYEIFFPKEINKWLLLRDYNCDGIEDIFTANSNGISVYKNITQPGGNLSWEKLSFFAPPAPSAPPGTPGIFTEILLTKGFSTTNIFPGTNDIPSITDMDGDGDLDIVNMRFVNPGTAEYHKNLSMENYGTCDSLKFERIEQRWGDWEECDCGTFAFGESCSATGGKTNHSVGKALLAIDVNGDGNKDLLFTEEDCPVLYYLQNSGTTENADMNAAVSFPQGKPAVMPLFPAAFYEDVDFDGKPDLLTSPAMFARTTLNNPFTNSIWFYKNTGTAQSPNFTFVKDNFLQDEMIEVGDYAYPAFVDYDGDGDQDLFIGNYGNAQFNGVISFYENVGTASSSSFRLVTDDYLSLSLLSQFSMKPQFVDFNGDGNRDLVFLISDPSTLTANLLYIPGNNPNSINFEGQEVLPTNFAVSNNENVLIEDIDQDGRMDILVGKSNGSLQYWRNSSINGSFSFSLEDEAFMGLGQSLTRTNLNMSIADMDNDGLQDLIIGDQIGNISIYGDFRGIMNSPVPSSNIIFDSFSQTYTTKNLGARIKPVAVSLFNSDKPAIVVGAVGGGLMILKNDGGQQLPNEPEIIIYPNPLPPSEKLGVHSDRNVLMQLFTIMGQKITEPMFIPGNQPSSMEIAGLAAGIYIARFTFAGKSYGRKFIIL